MAISIKNLIEGRVYKFGKRDYSRSSTRYLGKYTGDTNNLQGVLNTSKDETYTNIWTVRGYDDIEEASTEETAWIEYIISLNNEEKFPSLEEYTKKHPLLQDNYTIF